MRLPDCWVCYDPVTECPDVNELPAIKSGFLTFGSLNKLCKITSQTLTLWARVMNAHENSRLILLTFEGSHRKRLLDLFESHGISAQRIQLEAPRPRFDYLRLYNQIDLSLDPFPYNGSTTSCDGLWMGVPVVTLPGQIPVSRAGLSLLSNIGLQNLAASNDDEFVRIANDLARDLPQLAELRRTLRQCMRVSPIMDYPHFAQNLEAAYRSMWIKGCE